MVTEIINKTMSRSDLLSDEAKPVVQGINNVIRQLYAKHLYPSSWTGTLPRGGRVRQFIDGMLGRAESQVGVGMEQRLNYQPLPDAVDDGRFPWFLYWEILWVMKNTRQYLHRGMRLFDGGGTSSLFTCYLASLGFKVAAVDLNDRLVTNGNKIAQNMGWNMHSYVMGMEQLDFPSESFDHAYSICVFEHLDYDIKQAALAEIARCLKPGGVFSITFDYRNPAPGIVGYGKDTRPRNQLKTKADIRRSFLSGGHFDLMGNQEFYDNGESYLVHHRFDHTPYTFGAIFLRKRE
jgi:SAM-dependent methyltransferase